MSYMEQESRGRLQTKEKLIVIKARCPGCYHHKMFQYPGIDSYYRRKCTRCYYTEEKA